MTHVAKYLSLAAASEHALGSAFLTLADRHAADTDLVATLRLFAGWSAAHTRKLHALRNEHGRMRMADQPQRLRSALFHDPRVGGLGLLRDLHDAMLLVQQARCSWLVLHQAARSKQDEALAAVAAAAIDDAKRQSAWLETQLEVRAAQAVLVPGPKGKELRATLQQRFSTASLPDLGWAPFAAATAALALGLVGLAAGRPWLLPSIGPSLYLLAADGAHPANRPWNIVAGHLSGLAAGLLAVWLTGAAASPDVLQLGSTDGTHVAAAAIAMFVTVLLSLGLRAGHPPAAATALLVALGPLYSVTASIDVAVAAALTALIALAGRHLRLQWTRTKIAVEPVRRLRAGLPP